MTLASYQHDVEQGFAQYHGGSMAGRPSMIVVHATAGDTAAGAISWLNRQLKNGEHKASYHYVVDRGNNPFTTRIVRLLPPSMIAYHAGKSWWPAPPKPWETVNPFSIGVAFANDNGSDADLTDDPLTEYQKEAGLWLVATLCLRFGIHADRVLAHREVSPGRKTDPLPRILDMDAFRKTLSHLLGNIG